MKTTASKCATGGVAVGGQVPGARAAAPMAAAAALLAVTVAFRRRKESTVRTLKNHVSCLYNVVYRMVIDSRVHAVPRATR